MKTLKELYFINSPSGKENGMSRYLCKLLSDLNVDFETDEYLQIFKLDNPDMPIVCAHMDQIGNIPITSLIEKNGKITGNRNIGADDKNGIWICLELIKQFPAINFIFSTCEEIGGNIKEITQDIGLSIFPYCLVFDRKGKSDIIGYSNNYCSIEFETTVSDIGKHYGFKPAQGIFSDCDELSYHINCVNISCGYYNAHTNNEYTVISELLNSLQFAIAIIQDDFLNSQEWELDYYEDLPFMNNNNDFVCPVCGSILIDFVEGKEEGLLCLNCDYEQFIDWNNYGDY